MEPIEPVHERLEALLAEGDGGEAEETIRHLGRRLDATWDRRMRVVVIEDLFTSLDDAGLVAVLHRLLQGSIEGRSAHREILQELALEGEMLRSLPYDRVADLYRAAHAAGLSDVGRMFMGERLATNPTVAEAASGNDHLTLSAGERRSAARSGNRFLLDRVLRDRDPRVIRQFLANPRVVERDVVRIASTRPTKPEILKILAEHPRWSKRYELRKALVCNPYTPKAISLQLVNTLLAQDLRFLRSSSQLSEQVQQAVRRRLEAHAPGPTRAPTRALPRAASEE